jgi:chorismate mutase/prephenate dehydratase
MADPKERLEGIVEALAAADAAVADALTARARAMVELRELRSEDPEGWHPIPSDDETLAAVLPRTDVFPRNATEAVFREVLSGSAALIAPPRIAYLGPEGGFAHVAAHRRFGSAAHLEPVATVEEVLEEVVRGRASRGVVPLESSIEGAHTATLVALAQSEAQVRGELAVTLTYHLLTRATALEDIRNLYATGQGLATCERFVRSQLPQASLHECASAVQAAQHAEDRADAAAIVSDVVAGRSKAPVLRQRIEDRAGIRIRYALVGGEPPSRTGADRTLLAVALNDNPGALLAALQPFADRGLNVTRVESRPVLGAPWRSLFFFEVDGHVTDRAVVAATEEVRSASRFARAMGSYPRTED